MIVKCPCCGSWTQGDDSALGKMDASIRQSYKETNEQGQQIASEIDKSTRRFIKGGFGRMVGGGLKSISSAVAEAVSHGKSVIDGAVGMLNATQAAFVCSQCNHIWKQDSTDPSLDKSEEYYSERLLTFPKMPLSERRFVLVSKEASSLATPNGQIVVLHTFPATQDWDFGTIPSPNTLYAVHPSCQNRYIPFDSSYRISVFHEEIEDLIVFLGQLGASSISFTSADLDESEHKGRSVKTKKGQGAISFGKKKLGGAVESQYEEESEEFKKLSRQYTSTHRSEQLGTPHVDLRLAKKWFHIRPAWVKAVERRIHGELEFSITIATESVENLSKNQIDKLSAEYSRIAEDIQVDSKAEFFEYQKISRSFSMRLDVQFYSLKSYGIYFQQLQKQLSDEMSQM